MNAMNILRTPFNDRHCYNVCLTLVAVNVGVFFLFDIFFPRLKYLFCLVPGYVIAHHCYWQFFTYMFMHADFSHILFNMIGLFIFGKATEQRLGSKEFLLLYFVCGVFSGLCSFCIYCIFGAWGVCLLGASGAIYGILLSFAVLYPRATIFIWGIIPLPAPLLIVIYAFMSVGGIFIGQGNVAYITHLAGFVGAWLYFLVRMGISPIKVWQANIR